ncbi:mechanosensitive ion channel family protein [Saccharicrinis fermentans]|uniref:Miniconductance mechanosensitive channel n=2 Tax=Saccharicrinis fermentans TaxID=982 RepID=W7XW43_9BACT|nr:mechanosensitive ion channel domain-containing protein [Saccharicrinis fermentans]GAF02495.1 miniconductance mechanosensitive channel [Saccharicrinis fermentans DSM 9555 = JCM 21142]
MEKTKSKYDDFFVKRKLIKRTALLVPAFVIYGFTDLLFKPYPQIYTILHNVVSSYFIIVVLLMIDSFLKATQDIYNSQPYSKDKPIKGYVQGVQLVFTLIGILTIISIIFNVKLTVVFTGLGAIAAVLILVFKDTILGFVASIQLSANNMVKPGDWIVMPSRNADGTVLEITLNTVKIQNWDKTISTVPTYALVSESFTNWKGMEESGGRRIKRSINIDMKSVSFCTPHMIKKFKKVKFLQEYIQGKLSELEEYNKQFDIDESSAINGRNLTNLGVFRKYLESYLTHHPKIHNNMTFLVRHLQPTEKGLPIEIYVFSKDQEWANYESIQADIFDHILAVIPEFYLRVFQFPTEEVSNQQIFEE